MYAFLNSGEPYKLIFMVFFGIRFYMKTLKNQRSGAKKHKMLVYRQLYIKCIANV
jgi:hypothetical protein